MISLKLVIAAAVLLITAGGLFAQDTVTYRLSPEASKEYIDIEHQVTILRLRQQLILADAGVPKADRGRQVQLIDGVIVLPPKETKAK